MYILKKCYLYCTIFPQVKEICWKLKYNTVYNSIYAIQYLILCHDKSWKVIVYKGTFFIVLYFELFQASAGRGLGFLLVCCDKILRHQQFDVK